jgi:hypothetical protein
MAEIRKLRSRFRALKSGHLAEEDLGNKLAKPPVLLIVRSLCVSLWAGGVFEASHGFARSSNYQTKGSTIMRKSLAAVLMICVGALAVGCEPATKPAPTKVPTSDLGAPGKPDAPKTTPAPAPTTTPAPK